MDDRRFATIGDIVNGQVPNTIIMPPDAFTLANGGQLVCLPTHARLSAEFAVNANLGVVGPYLHNPVGTEFLRVQGTVPVPHRYMRHFLHQKLTPREAWELSSSFVRPSLVGNTLRGSVTT